MTTFFGGTGGEPFTPAASGVLIASAHTSAAPFMCSHDGWGHRPAERIVRVVVAPRRTTCPLVARRGVNGQQARTTRGLTAPPLCLCLCLCARVCVRVRRGRNLTRPESTHSRSNFSTIQRPVPLSADSCFGCARAIPVGHCLAGGCFQRSQGHGACRAAWCAVLRCVLHAPAPWAVF